MQIAKYAEPISYKTKSKIGILFSHGFTGNNTSIKFLADKFYNAGFNVEFPRLKGHGTNWEDLGTATYNDWIKDVDDAYKNLKKRANIIFVGGLSMGGTLALELAYKNKEIAQKLNLNPCDISRIRKTLLKRFANES